MMAHAIWSRLSRAAGLFATPLAPSHYLALVDPLLGAHDLKARVESIAFETQEARTIVLRPGRGFRPHLPGQHVRVGVTIDGRRATRTYSIASSPRRKDGRIAITVKIVPDGKVSGFFARDAAPGDTVALSQPMGDFVLPAARAVRPLFVTAGSGITPVMSMLRTLAIDGAMPDAVHVHYAPDACSVIFRDELRRIAEEHPRYRLHLVHTRELPKDARHFEPYHLDALCPDWREREAWACGPASLLDALRDAWARAGIAEALHVERFRAPIATDLPESGGGEVTFARSGARARADGKTPLLLVAESAGLQPAHGCRMGICRTCDATLVRGRVRDLRTGAATSEPGARVQLCVCAAAGDVEVDV